MATHSRLTLCATVGVVGLAGARHSLAQSDQPASTAAAGLEEVVLTARRREERVQIVRLAVTALTFADYADNEVVGAVNISIFNDKVFLRVAGRMQWRAEVTRDVSTGNGLDNQISLFLARRHHRLSDRRRWKTTCSMTAIGKTSMTAPRTPDRPRSRTLMSPDTRTRWDRMPTTRACRAVAQNPWPLSWRKTGSWQARLKSSPRVSAIC